MWSVSAHGITTRMIGGHFYLFSYLFIADYFTFRTKQKCHISHFVTYTIQKYRTKPKQLFRGNIREM